MHDGPSIGLADHEPQSWVSPKAQRYGMEQPPITLTLNGETLQVGWQWIEALPHCSVSVEFGPVAHDAVVPILTLPTIQNLLRPKERIMKVIRRTFFDHLNSARGRNCIFRHFWQFDFIRLNSFLILHSSVITGEQRGSKDKQRG